MNIRKKWLIAFLVSAIYGLLGYFYFLWKGNYALNNEALHGASQWMLLMPVAISGIFSWIFIHYAYRKRGTILLTIMVVFGPLSSLFSLVKGVQSLNQLQELMPFSLPVISLVCHLCASTGLFVWYWIFSFQLLKENRALKKERISSCLAKKDSTT